MAYLSESRCNQIYSAIESLGGFSLSIYGGLTFYMDGGVYLNTEIPVGDSLFRAIKSNGESVAVKTSDLYTFKRCWEDAEIMDWLDGAIQAYSIGFQTVLLNRICTITVGEYEFQGSVLATSGDLEALGQAFINLLESEDFGSVRQ